MTEYYGRCAKCGGSLTTNHRCPIYDSGASEPETTTYVVSRAKEERIRELEAEVARLRGIVFRVAGWFLIGKLENGSFIECGFCKQWACEGNEIDHEEDCLVVQAQQALSNLNSGVPK